MRKILNDEFISKLETLSFHMNSFMRGYFGGNHRTSAYGSTVEFADFREYTLGDDIRHIDWNLYSRFEKHFIKLFVDERQMFIQVYLDCSASMEKADSKKSEFALKTAASIGYLAVHNMDRLSYRLIQGDSAFDLSGTIIGKDNFFRTISLLEETEFKGEADLDKAITGQNDVGTNDGLTVIISDFLTDSNWKKAVDYLLYKKRQVMLIQVLAPDELKPLYTGRIRLVDSESSSPIDDKNMKMKITKADIKAYNEALKDFKEDMKNFCMARGVNFISISSDEKIEQLIFNKLAQVGTVT
ncbi:DUF58 domain-containing protein [Acholeplasma equirhinis]|uniref:DUF58 domain-containing protein n=1 Tax=Acholeplasma equirhinis TaxID=555393 RepID=UPI00197A8FBB|nr:DUF58 domain-containing protein [Acholeplasma equirhinis]MBN3489891.1 DUF58 domain-containing protein [Acholeplasma equirhinis]